MDLLLKINSANRVHIENFGPSICGINGEKEFSIIINDNFGELARIEKVTLDKLFSRFNPKGEDFLNGVYRSTDFFIFDPTTMKISGKTELGFRLSLKAKYTR